MIPLGNAEVVRQALDAWGRRDAAALRELADEQIEFRSSFVAGMEGGVYRGHDDIDRNFADIDEVFDDWHTEDERFLELGGGVVLALYRIVGKGKASGVPLDQQVGMLFTLREGRIVLAEGYLDSQEALRVAFAHAFRLFGAGDIDAAVKDMDPDVEWEHQPGTGAPEEGLHRGRDEVRSLLERLREAWHDFGVEVHEVIDAGGDRYIAKGTIHATGRTSDIELNAGCEYAVTFRDSKAVHIHVLFNTTGASMSSSQETTDVA